MKMPDMDVIEEVTEESKINEAEEQAVMKNETFDSFIVNADYFGDDPDNKMFDDQSMDITQIGSKNTRGSDASNLLITRNLDATNI